MFNIVLFRFNVVKTLILIYKYQIKMDLFFWKWAN